MTLVLTTIALPAADFSGKRRGWIERVGGAMCGVRTDEHFITIAQNGAAITGTAGPKRDVQWDIVNARLSAA